MSEIDKLENDVQEQRHSYTVWNNDNTLLYASNALAGEVGEVANEVKKLYRACDGDMYPAEVTSAEHEKIALELGDVLWYLTALAQLCGYSLEDVSRMNQEKLAKRRAEVKT